MFLIGSSDFAFSQIDYTPWAEVLSNYVDDNGRVDYGRLDNNREDFDRFIGEIAHVDISRFSLNEGKAFWINAYNALTIEAVLNSYPVASIRNIWNIWYTPRRVARGSYTLYDIENRILRSLKDPRIHFAISYAALGGPNLARIPFYPDRLNDQLNKAAARFINDSRKVKLDRDNKIIYVSPVFFWFKQDFSVAANSIVDFVKYYISPDRRQFLQYNKVMLKSLKYDWNLNNQ